MAKKIAMQFTILTFIIMIISWGGMYCLRTIWAYARQLCLVEYPIYARRTLSHDCILFSFKKKQ